MPNRKILTPMWTDGKELFAYSDFPKSRRIIHPPTERVWVGIERKDMTNERMTVNLLKDWMFQDFVEGYNAVKEFNQTQKKVDFPKGK